ncbi:hypothetical protein MKX67_05715 [Cytobacillus sp. FSL W7-1323]|nr:MULTISPECIES: hypothetical protein [Cytobacillus]MEA1854181.1 hypothetical protein [Cytobacillus sp. OWB-43]MED1607200.1 hypothetical protein [Cytobacillus kochii]
MHNSLLKPVTGAVLIMIAILIAELKPSLNKNQSAKKIVLSDS